MPLLILLHILLFSLSKPSFFTLTRKKVQSSFYNFDLSATSLSSQRKSETTKKTLSGFIENTRDLKKSENKDSFENKRLFLKKNLKHFKWDEKLFSVNKVWSLYYFITALTKPFRSKQWHCLWLVTLFYIPI